MNKLLLSMARQIHRRLVAHSRTDPALAMLGDVREAQWRFNTAWQRLQTARQRGWHDAARLVRQDLFARAGELHEKLGEAIAQESVSPPPLPSLWLVIEELQQLHDEFENVELCMNQHGQRRVKAVTEPITLEEVELGRFSIELDLHRLSTRCTSACFDCKALDPNYASSNSDVTHPHVSGNALCAGEATLPISNALSQGRICDAFCLVRSVLTTYNDASPYVALDQWNGMRCGDCESLLDENDLYTCDHCDRQFCNDCISTCDLCDNSTCHGCLERDNKSDQACCPNCRSICGKCDRVVNCDDFDSESGLCPQCQPQDKENDDHEHDPEQPTEHSADGATASANSDGETADNTEAPTPTPITPAPQPGGTPDPDLQPAGVAQAAVLPARRRHRNRRVRRQQRR